jgi:RNA polymerase sigma factor (sigma-70 family)
LLKINTVLFFCKEWYSVVILASEKNNVIFFPNLQLSVKSPVITSRSLKTLGTSTDIHKPIIEAAKRGDNRARHQLYELYARAMFNICLRFMNSREDAEDVLQEAFVQAFTRMDSFRYESAFGSWLKRIVINHCINTMKKRKVDLKLSDDMGHYKHLSDEEPEENLPLSVADIQNALNQLPEGGRIVFSLYLLEGYDHQEIAAILGITESTSKSQFMRAKRRVYELLKGKYYETA